MKLLELLPGTKIDLRIFRDVENESKTGEQAVTYLSQIHEVLREDEFEMQMPMQNGKIVLVPANVRYEAVFISNKGMFKAECIVEDRYKKGNFYLMRGRLVSNLVKYQRRQFYRFPCQLPIVYSSLDAEVAGMDTMEGVKMGVKTRTTNMVVRGYGTILDISGGGLRFSSSFDLSQEKYLYLQFSLNMDGQKRTLEQVGTVLKSWKPDGSDKYMNRVKILYKDTDYQELIVRYVFEEERRQRQEGMK